MLSMEKSLQGIVDRRPPHQNGYQESALGNRGPVVIMLKLATIALLAPAALLAGPVAEGYPDWQGLSDKSYIVGREICPSDLRHKVTVVIEVEPNEKLKDQLIVAVPLVNRSISYVGQGSTAFDCWEMPRNLIVVVSCRGFAGKGRAMFLAALTPSTGDRIQTQVLSQRLRSGASAYEELTFTGAPDSTGKRPFVYVMGPTGKDPLCQGPLNDTTIKEANAAITKTLKEIDGWDPKWRPFYGTVAEPKFNVTLAKALEKGKTAKVLPLAPVSKALLTDVKSKDPERAKEAQILFDAIEQTRSDLLLRIRLERGFSPHCAYYDLETLKKYWPAERKRLEASCPGLKMGPEIEAMGKMYCKLVEWTRPEFTCKNAGEAKKIVQELNKMKKALAGPKESKNIGIQNVALLLDMKADELISNIPARVHQNE